jgi:hypothetical protein
MKNSDFNWTRLSGSTVLISDRYDFEYDPMYDGLAGTAVNLMALAQNAGAIKPFYVYITA